MKKTLIIVVLLFNVSINLFSQTLGYDVSILIKEKIKVREISNDTLIHQEYSLKEKIKYVKQDISFDKKGLLQTRLEVSGVNRDSQLIFIYTNVKDRNPPLIFKKEKIKNLLSFPKDFEGIKIEKFRNLFKKAKNIYIIESDSILGYYILKKVTLSDKLFGL